MMRVQFGKKARVYTWPEVEELLHEYADQINKNRDVVMDALCADHERIMLVLCLRALMIEGFQKNPLERLMGEIAKLTDEINAGKIDYNADCLAPVEECLGYEIRDSDLEKDLCDRVEVRR
ncbi:MAG: hypothetical protein J6P60_01825 [Lachnospiraceae bacterium]|nr:hypothetical protein [Lachnospiraceae bacterium]